MKKNHRSGDDQSQRTSARFTKLGLVVVLALVAFLFLVRTFFSTSPVQEIKVSKTESPESHAETPKPGSAAALVAAKREARLATGALIPKSMTLTRKVLVSKEWNNGPDAFGMKGPEKGEEGGVWGPASVACVNDDIYVMDNVHGRLLRYNKDGSAAGSVALSNPSICGDLVANPSDSSLWVIDSDFNTIYKVKDGEVVLTKTVPTRNLTDRSLWGYDAVTDTLFCRDPEKGGDVPVLKNGQVIDESERTVRNLSSITPDLEGPENLVLDLGNGKNVRIAFGQPLECVEQIVTDGQGMIWMLYNLTGDFRMRRLARVDPSGHTVGVATLDDVWFAVDGSRHMAATENGVVLFVGGEKEGSLLSFDYEGGAL